MNNVSLSDLASMCKIQNRPLYLVRFVLPVEVPGGLNNLSVHNLCVDMHVNKTKFERNGSLEYHYMTRIGETKHTS